MTPYEALKLESILNIFQILYLAFVIVISIMLMDMMIGTMSRTLDYTTEFEKEWIRQVKTVIALLFIWLEDE